MSEEVVQVFNSIISIDTDPAKAESYQKALKLRVEQLGSSLEGSELLEWVDFIASKNREMKDEELEFTLSQEIMTFTSNIVEIDLEVVGKDFLFNLTPRLLWEK